MVVHGLRGSVPVCFHAAGSSLQPLSQGRAPLSGACGFALTGPSWRPWPPHGCQLGESHAGSREGCCPAWPQPQMDVCSRGCHPRGLPGLGVALVIDVKASGARPGLVPWTPHSQPRHATSETAWQGHLKRSCKGRGQRISSPEHLTFESRSGALSVQKTWRPRGALGSNKIPRGPGPGFGACGCPRARPHHGMSTLLSDKQG